MIQESLRVIFDIRWGGDPSQQSSTIKVYNLRTGTADTITEREAPVRLSAGYSDTPLGLLFSGEVRRGDTERHGLDRITTLALGVADAKKNAMFARAYRMVPLPTIIRDVAGTMGLAAHPSISLVPTDVLDTYSVADKCALVLDALLTPRKIRWWARDGLLVFGAADGTPGTGTITINQDTGLIGSPARTEDGMKALMVLAPAVEIGQKAVLESDLLSGEYTVKTILHHGDTWQGAWSTGIEGTSA